LIQIGNVSKPAISSKTHFDRILPADTTLSYYKDRPIEYLASCLSASNVTQHSMKK